MTPQAALETAYLTRTETMDGVEGVPWYICQALGGPAPSRLRLARYGYVRACGSVNYGPEYGVRTTVLWQSGGLVFYPDADGWEMKAQKVGTEHLAWVATVLGVAALLGLPETPPLYPQS